MNNKTRKKKPARVKASNSPKRRKQKKSRVRCPASGTKAAGLSGVGYITVYRGTSLIQERQIWAETDGYVFSEAALDGYRIYINRGYDFAEALNAATNYSNRVLGYFLQNWGGADCYADAHSQLGTELAREFGPRPAVSWTTDYDRARYYARDRDGYVLETRVWIGDILNANWKQNEENEVLIGKVQWAKRLR